MQGIMELKVTMVSQDCQVLQVPLVTQDTKDPKDKKEVKVTMELRGHKGSGAERGLEGPEGSQDPQGLERRGRKVLLVNQDLLVLLVQSARLGPKAQGVLRVLLVRQANQDLKASVENQDYLVRRGRGVLLDFRESKVIMVRKDLVVPQVTQDYQACQDQPERKDPKDLQELLELMVTKAKEVITVLLGYQGSEVHLGLQGTQAYQEHPGFKGHQEYQGILDNQEPRVRQENQEESSMQGDPVLWPSPAPQEAPEHPVKPDPQGYQAPLALLVFLASLVLKVREG